MSGTDFIELKYIKLINKMSKILQVAKTHKETDDSLLITLDIPQNLRKLYKYRPGQFITLETHIAGKLYKRPYSLCGNPNQEDELSVLVKRVPGGVVSNYLNDHVKTGTIFKIGAPQGNFKVTPGLLKMNHYVFFAAGCGITPIISMIESIMKKEPLSKVILFYSNKTWEGTIFRERLKALWEVNPNRFKFQMILTSSMATGATYGRLDTSKCKNLLGQHLNDHKRGKYYLCGPSGFMGDVMVALAELQIPSKNIHFESFGGASLSPTLAPSTNAAPALPAIDTEIEVIIDKRLYTIPVGRNQMILDSALSADLDVNYSCRSGNCSSCKAKLINGQVTSKPSTGLLQKEIEAGYILTCQSQPASAGVKIEYCM